ncbi:MAG: type II toxin-antitoxin system HicB family antitoxin [Myxococcota bacterium]|nr:type II toxin-antitoxin system HicB family antitoxin [Myxococcota bacterium]
MSRRYAVAVVKEGSEHWAFVPDVPGVYGRGKSRDQAVAEVTEALADYLAFLRERGESTPEPSPDAVEVRFAVVPG